MKRKNKLLTILLTALLIFGANALAQAEEEGDLDKMKSDKTGTNPVNFQREIRIYNDYQWLNTAGDGNQNITTMEFRTTFLHGKWQYRLRVPYKSLESDTNNDGVDNFDDDGLGDIDMRFLTVPYMNKEKMQALAYGLEVFVDTASEDSLGAGTTSLGPQVFFAQFFKRGMFAPGLQYKFSVYEDEGRADTEQIVIDLNLLIMAKDKKSWFFADPQIVFNLENYTESAVIDLEFGVMVNKFTDSEAFKGHSAYIRPSFGSGKYRGLDYGVEVGYKIVGW